MLAIPAYFAAIGAEYAWQRAHPVPPGTRAGDYQTADTLASLAMGVGSLVAPYAARKVLRPGDARPREVRSRRCWPQARPRRCSRPSATSYAAGCATAACPSRRPCPTRSARCRRSSPGCDWRPRCRARSVRPCRCRGRSTAGWRWPPSPAPRSPSRRSGRPARRRSRSSVAAGSTSAARGRPGRRRSWAGTSSTTGTTGSCTSRAGCGRCTSPTTPASATTSRRHCGSRWRSRSRSRSRTRCSPWSASARR